jgi:hypothetical protein
MAEIMEKAEVEETETNAEIMENGCRNFCLGVTAEEPSREQQIEMTFSSYLKEIKDAEKGKSKNPLKYLKKPDICDELISANESRRNWYGGVVDNNNNNNEPIYEDHEATRATEKRKEYEIHKKQINEFKNRYNSLQGRDPFDTEIIDNMKDTVPINIIEQIIRENN